MARRRRRDKQLEMKLHGWGGRRPGAGRPVKGKLRTVLHRRRARFRKGYPLLVTLRVDKGVWNLRNPRCLALVEDAIDRASERPGFRVVHYSVQRNHVHLILEANDRAVASRGMQSFSIRVAKGLNALMGTRGKVFSQRYHDVVLRTPRRTRNALAYVLNNARRHGLVRRGARKGWVDPCSSAARFEGFVGTVVCSRDGPPAGAPPGTWLLREGWKRGGGRIPVDYVPVAGR